MSLTGEIVTDLSQGHPRAWIAAALLAGVLGVGLWMVWESGEEAAGELA